MIEVTSVSQGKISLYPLQVDLWEKRSLTNPLLPSHALSIIHLPSPILCVRGIPTNSLLVYEVRCYFRSHRLANPVLLIIVFFSHPTDSSISQRSLSPAKKSLSSLCHKRKEENICSLITWREEETGLDGISTSRTWSRYGNRETMRGSRPRDVCATHDQKTETSSDSVFRLRESIGIELQNNVLPAKFASFAHVLASFCTWNSRWKNCCLQLSPLYLYLTHNLSSEKKKRFKRYHHDFVQSYFRPVHSMKKKPWLNCSTFTFCCLDWLCVP